MRDDMAGKTHEKSPLAAAIEIKEDEAVFFDVSGIFGLGGKAIERIAIIRGRGRDFENAVLAAHAYAATTVKRAGEGAAGALADFDFMGDAKIRQIVFRLCLAVDPKDPNKLARTGNGKGVYPAFPSPEWVCDHLHTDQLASLMRLVAEVRRKKAPRPEGMSPDEDPLGLTDEAMERMIELLSAQLHTDLPERVLRDLDREFLTHFVVMVCDKLVEARKSVESLLTERAENEKQIAELEEELARRLPIPGTPADEGAVL